MTARLGERSLLAAGRGRPLDGAGVAIGTGLGRARELRRRRHRRHADHASAGARVFGHRCLVVGATVGDLCEIGNASILMPGARLGDRVFLGEGTLVPSG